VGFAIDSAEPKRPFTGSASLPPQTQNGNRTFGLSFLTNKFAHYQLSPTTPLALPGIYAIALLMILCRDFS